MAGQGGRLPLSLPAYPNRLPGWKLCHAYRSRRTNPPTMSGTHRRSINTSERLAKPERQNNGGYPIRVLDREDMPCARCGTCNRLCPLRKIGAFHQFFKSFLSSTPSPHCYSPHASRPENTPMRRIGRLFWILALAFATLGFAVWGSLALLLPHAPGRGWPVAPGFRLGPSDVADSRRNLHEAPSAGHRRPRRFRQRHPGMVGRLSSRRTIEIGGTTSRALPWPASKATRSRSATSEPSTGGRTPTTHRPGKTAPMISIHCAVSTCGAAHGRARTSLTSL